MSRMVRRPGRGALYLLSVLLLASASLRIGTNVGQALAASEETGPAAVPLNCPTPPAALVEALSLREQRVRVQEAALAEKTAALALAEDVVTRRLAEFATAEDRLRATLSLADGAAERDLKQLTEVYQAMKPKEAAAIFAGMDPQFAAGFLGRMQPQAAAAILAGMPPDTAYAMSVLIAGRNANAPRE